jgi:hypothetical protein
MADKDKYPVLSEEFIKNMTQEKHGWGDIHKYFNGIYNIKGVKAVWDKEEKEAILCPKCGCKTKCLEVLSLFGEKYKCFKCTCGWCG